MKKREFPAIQALRDANQKFDAAFLLLRATITNIEFNVMFEELRRAQRGESRQTKKGR